MKDDSNFVDAVLELEEIKVKISALSQLINSDLDKVERSIGLFEKDLGIKMCLEEKIQALYIYHTVACDISNSVERYLDEIKTRPLNPPTKASEKTGETTD